MQRQSLTAEQIEDLWLQFRLSPSSELRQQLVLHYIGIVRYVIKSSSLPPSTVLGEDDFLQVGILGLSESIDRYDAERGVKFETFAIPRIKGVILDEVRRTDWLSRTARKRSSEYLQTADRLRSEYGREASSEEIREKLGLSEEEYRSYLQAAAAATSSLSLNDSTTVTIDDEDAPVDILENVADQDGSSVEESMTEEEYVSYIERYLLRLPERQRLVMTLYYYEELTFKEIGSLLGITESRISQIHSSIVADMRRRMKKI